MKKNKNFVYYQKELLYISLLNLVMEWKKKISTWIRQEFSFHNFLWDNMIYFSNKYNDVEEAVHLFFQLISSTYSASSDKANCKY